MKITQIEKNMFGFSKLFIPIIFSYKNFKNFKHFITFLKLKLKKKGKKLAKYIQCYCNKPIRDLLLPVVELRQINYNYQFQFNSNFTKSGIENEKKK